MSAYRERSSWPFRILVAIVALGLHIGLLGWLQSAEFRHQALPAGPDVVAVDLYVPPPPPPEPEPEPEPEREPEPEPPAPEPEPQPEPPKPTVRRPPPAPATPPTPRGPPVHSFGANQQWAAPPTPPPAATSTRGRMAPSGYANTVKGRVTANLQRPEGAVYKPPPGYRGDPNDFKRQCYIPYEITVDGAGQMVGFEIDPCGDALLDQAAREAIRRSGPFPPPPGGGEGRYTIYGTAIFLD